MQFWREVAFGLLPPREFFLSEHTHSVHIVEHTVGLHPVEAGDRGVQVFHHLHRLVDVTVGLGHAIDGVAALHGLDTWQTHLLTIEHETLAYHFEFTDTKMIRNGIAHLAALNRLTSKIIQIRLVKVPHHRLLYCSINRKVLLTLLLR